MTIRLSPRPPACMVWSLAALLLLPSAAALADTADDYYARGLKLYLGGDYAKASAEIRQALQEDPEHTQAKELLQLLEEAQRQAKPQEVVLSQLSAALEAQQQDARRLKSVLASAEARLTALLAARQADQAALGDLRKQLSQAQQVIVDAQQQLTDAQAKLAQEREQSAQSLRALEEQGAKASKELDSLRSEKDHLGKQLAQTKDELVAAKNEAGQLKVTRNELDRMKKAAEKSGQEIDQLKKERVQLKDQAASLGRQLDDQAKLQAKLHEAEERVARRDEQLQKLREIHSALDQQYAGLEMVNKELEANFQSVERKRAALADELAKTQEAAAAAQERAQSDYATLKQLSLETQQRLGAELAQGKAREAQYAKEIEALQSAQLALQQRLTDTRQKGVSVEAELTDARKTKGDLEDAMKARDAQLTELNGQLQQLQRALTEKSQAFQTLSQASASEKESLANVQEQMRVAKETQAKLNDQIKDFQALKADRDKLQSMLNEREAVLTKLQGEVASLTRDMDAAKKQIQLAEASGQERAEQLRIDQKGQEWRLDSAQRELEELRSADARLQIDLETSQKRAEEEHQFREQVAKKLQEREAQLKQAESVIRLLQGKAGATGLPAAPGPLSMEEAPREPEPAEAVPQAPAVEALSAASAAGGPEPSRDYPIKVFQVNDELQFLVFSLEGMQEARVGIQLLLLAQDRPVAAVQVSELDNAGFAVAQITKMIEPPRQIRKGDLLYARPLPPS